MSLLIHHLLTVSLARILMSTIQNLGICPCPRCTTLKSKAHLIGMKGDRKARIALTRIDDDKRRGLVSAAQKAIYQGNFDVDSAPVERLLKPQSLVPTTVRNSLLSEYTFSSSSFFTECVFQSTLLPRFQFFPVICG